MRPTNPMVSPMLTDLYQLTMAYAYWKSDRHEDRAVFDLFFRKCPFGGEFTVFAGLSEVLKFVSKFRFTKKQIKYIQSLLPHADPAFFEWLATINCKDIKIYAIPEGTLVFPRVPLIRVEGPLAIAQLLETTLLNLVNYASLIATNAARFRLAAGWDKKLLEFGLRRAQGPDGALSASIYSYLGGFDGTSNVLAGETFGIPVSGTHAHAFVTSYVGLFDLKENSIITPSGETVDFVSMVLAARDEIGFKGTNEGELAAFIAYAQAFPDKFLALVDTYDTLNSGIPNFLFNIQETPHGGGVQRTLSRRSAGMNGTLPSHAKRGRV